ncbi:ribbon-helix-helix protein, CopG family [Telmatospirillum siberiense]|uniref:Ribbon-helix-helix protein, CopG family n=1 Tax=Telmatospirillum siberiense TaxID=382514 RepID=A0A2N3PSK9_9PROT|nr:ribbon-helix-helix protein, CopG family [Telmatospirillum siberiense]PKU23374.1 ribbon-helix-helix protein, CopG family [Telmatospirillum siberiense]
MSTPDLLLALTPAMRERLEDISAQLGRTLEECAQTALTEFIENWDDYMRTVAELEKGDEERPVLRAVND